MAEKSNPPSQMSGNLRPGLALAVCLTALAACASPPQQSARLETARTQFGALQNNPAVRQADPVSLQQAQQNLQQAEIAQQNGDMALTDHFALLAQRQMEAATTKANAQTAQQAQQQLMQQSGKSSQELTQDLRLLGAQRTERGIVLSSFNLPFRTGSDELPPTAARDLQPLVAFLREHPQEVITVEGFTDSSGNNEANQQLSQRRADAVAGFLASQGIDSRRAITRGMGEEYPVASNATPSGRQANRRVDVVFNMIPTQTAEIPSSEDMMPQSGMAAQPPQQPFAPTIEQQGMAPPPPTLSPGAPGGPSR